MLKAFKQKPNKTQDRLGSKVLGLESGHTTRNTSLKTPDSGLKTQHRSVRGIGMGGLIGLWLMLCGVAIGQPSVPPPKTTAFTRGLIGTNTTSAEFRSALGFLSTNNTVITNYTGNGASITNLNADELRSGTVPLARLSGITASQVADATLTTNKVDATFHALLGGGGGSGDVTQSGLAAGSYAMPNFAPKFFNVETNFSPAQFSATYRYFNTLNTTQANLYVNSTTGNNATAQRNNPNLPWRDIWELIDSTLGSVVTTGAVAVAKSGDTVVLQSGVYFAPKIPLPNGVHLFAPNGATIIRTNFTRDVNVLSPGSGGAYGSDLGIGALIKPGNNSVVDGVVVVATNGSFDACIGYYDRAQVTDGSDWDYGFTESISTNSLFRNCFFYGGSDVHYLDGTNTGTGTIYFDNCVFRSQWDAIRSYSNSITYTKDCDIFTTNSYSTSPALGASRAVVMQANSKWYDYGSRVGAGGGTNENNATYFIDNSAAILSGTVLYISGTNAAYDIVRSNSPSGWYLEGGTFRQ